MKNKLNALLDVVSEFIAARKGLLLLIGLLLIIANLVLQLFPGLGWVVQANLLLHIGLVCIVLGIMLAWAL